MTAGTDLVTTFLDRAARRPTDVAVVDASGATTTYDALRRHVLGIGHRLLADGLRPGDGVLFALRPSPAAVAAFLGILAAGGVVAAADTAVGPRLFSARLRAARPGWLVAESALYPASRLAPLRTVARRRGWGLPDLREPIADRGIRHVYNGRWWPGVPRGAWRLDDVAGSDARRTEPVPADPEDPALVVFTSGTTERPKGVVHSRGSLAATAAMIGGRFPFEPGDAIHAEGLVATLPALAAGARISIPGGSRDPAGYVRELTDRGVTHAYGVPVHLAEAFRAAPRWPDRLRYLLMGSAPAAPAVLRQALSAAPRAEVHSVYAMTEAIPIATVRAGEKLGHTEAGRAGDLLGAPVPGVRVRTAPDGELLVAGANACTGYLGEPPLAEVPSGDLARIGPAGELVMLGRKKDMIIRGSYNIYPGLYEPVIAQLPGVREAALVGLADPRTQDETVVLAVVAEPGADAGALPRRLRRGLPRLIDAEAVPDRIVVLPELPRSGRSRKLDRRLLRAQLGGAG